MKKDYDVIVVGAGGSGLAAARAAAELGGQVLILEKLSRPGGTTAMAIGSFTAAGTHLQRNAQIADNPEAHAEDVRLIAPAEIEARNDDALRRFFLAEAAATFDWLEEIGLSFLGPHPEPPNRVARMHNVVPGGRAYVSALKWAALRAGATLKCNADVQSLLREQGRVVGVRAVVSGRSRELRARRGVILAAGDYANSPEQIAAHKGSEYRHIDGINPDAKGDGHRLADAAGAQLVNMDVTYGPELRFVPPQRSMFRLPVPTRGRTARWLAILASRLPARVSQALIKRKLVTWQHPENALFEDGAILLNRDGQRFVDETSSPAREIAVAAQSGKIAYLLLDGRLVSRYSAWPHFISTAPDIAYAYVRDYQRLRSDITTTGYTLEDVGLRVGLDDQKMRQTVDEFNQYVAGERGDRFGRKHDTRPLDTDPWVLLGPLKAYFTTTEGGALVNESLQVVDREQQIIPGLYAVGQNGLGGLILWGHGLHIAWAITSGRLAGTAIMRGTSGNLRPEHSVDV